MPKPVILFKKSGNPYGEGIFYCYQEKPMLLIKITIAKGNIYTMEVYGSEVAIKPKLREMQMSEKGCTRDEFVSARMIVVDNMLNTAKMFNV